MEEAAISSFKVFDQVYVLTEGGPGQATTTLIQYIYTNTFQNYRMGYGAAAAVVLFLIIFVITVIQYRGQNKWNDFLAPLIFLKTKSILTIPLGLKMFVSEYNVEYGKMVAGEPLWYVYSFWNLCRIGRNMEGWAGYRTGGVDAVQ